MRTFRTIRAFLLRDDNRMFTSKGEEIGEVPMADPLTPYKITDIDSTEGNSYFGYVDKDGKWYIMNLTASAARYVKGDSGYLDAWGNKGGLDYDYFNVIF